jgi:hypothetical protein
VAQAAVGDGTEVSANLHLTVFGVGLTFLAINPRVEVAERITRAVVEHHPYALCFSCLAVELTMSEFDTRHVEQVAVLRDGLRPLQRVCYRCSRPDDMLVAPDPTCPS